jgi:hypothetical protein
MSSVTNSVQLIQFSISVFEYPVMEQNTEFAADKVLSFSTTMMATPELSNTVRYRLSPDSDKDDLGGDFGIIKPLGL